MDKWDWGENAYEIKSRAQIVWKSKRLPIKQIESYALSKTSINLALEFGCGGGSMGLSFVVRGCNVVFSDYSKQMLKSCRKNINKMNIKEYTEKIACQNMFAMGIKSDSVDLIFSDGVYEHVHEKDKRRSILKEQLRLLKLNGCLGIVIPNNKHPLVGYWIKKGFPWFDKDRCADWEIRLSANDLAQELKDAGFKDVYVDGCRVYEMIGKWPLTKLRHILMSLCKLFLPEWNRKFRIKYGTYLFAVGRK